MPLSTLTPTTPLWSTCHHHLQRSPRLLRHHLKRLLPRQQTPQGILIALASATLFGLMAFLSHCATQSLPSPQVLLIRTTISLLTILPFTLHHLPNLLQIPHHPLLWIRSLFSATSVIFLYLNIGTIGAGPAALFVDMSLLTVIAVSTWRFGIRLQTNAWLALSIILAGNLLLNWPEPHQTIPPQAVTLGLIGSVLAAVSFLLLQPLTHRYSHPQILLTYTLATLPLPCLLWSPQWHWPTSTTLWLTLTAMGLTSTLQQLTLTAAYKRLPAWLGGTLLLTGVLWASLLDAAFLNVRYTPKETLALAIIFLGILLVKFLAPGRGGAKPSPWARAKTGQSPRCGARRTQPITPDISTTGYGEAVGAEGRVERV